MRFLGVKKTLSPAELRYLTDVDHHNHEALAALDRAGRHGVGIARYVRDGDDLLPPWPGNLRLQSAP
jgi:hypothetical protein